MLVLLPWILQEHGVRSHKARHQSDERIKGLQDLAQDVYSQACSRIQELLGVVESQVQLSLQGFQNRMPSVKFRSGLCSRSVGPSQ